MYIGLIGLSWRIIISFIILFLGLGSVRAQLNQDSLLNIWNGDSSPTMRLEAFDQYINGEFQASHYDSLPDLVKSEIDFAISNQVVSALFFMWEAPKNLSVLAHPPKVKLSRHKQLIQAVKDSQNDSLLAKTHNWAGKSQRLMGNYISSVEQHYNALALAESLGDSTIICESYNFLATLHLNQGEFEEILKFGTKSAAIAKRNLDTVNYITGMMNIGLYHAWKGNKEECLSYFEICTKLSYKEGITTNLSIIDNYIAAMYINKFKDYENGLHYLNKALVHAKDAHYQTGIITSYNNIGLVLLNDGQLAKAEKSFLKALKLAKETNFPLIIQDASSALYLTYKEQGNEVAALEMLEFHINIKDSLNREENHKAILREQFQYQYEKQAIADSIKHQQEQEVLNAKLIASDAETKQHQAESAQRTQQLFFTVGILLLAIVLGLFIYNRYRMTNKQKRVIEFQKEQIVESINYSQKIQAALLPDLVDLNDSFQDVFVYFRPKDIVSGDFYWIKDIGNQVVIACVDCTGHGVPGGFMSTLGSLLLNKVAETDDLDPGSILEKLSNEIITSLKQDKGGEIQDGMDISLCLIDKVKHSIQFSGARNGIITIGEKGTKRYKPSILPVGGSYLKKGKPIERNFKSAAVEATSDDWVFMYTDGYMEQLGGQSDLPMNYGEFEAILNGCLAFSNHNERIAYLDNQFNTWKLNHEQFDDLLIIGLKPRFQDSQTEDQA